MVRTIAKLLGLLFVASLAAGAASAIAAASYKRKAPPLPDPAADEIDLVGVMDGIDFASTASSFRGGRLISWYAGVNLDLREATLDLAGADLEARTVFGGTRIVVAPGTPVTVGGPTIFGGRSDSTGAPEPAAGAPTLRVGGFTIFGGLEVIAVERGAELPGEDDEERGDEPGLEVNPDGTPA